MQHQRQLVAGEGMAAANVAGRGGAGAGGGTAVSRPCVSRWTPTPEQIKKLKELYHDCGIRSPNAEQIQRITAMLRQHGRVEGKNVFYWFQNHKARERHKRRLTNLDVNAAPAAAAATTGACDAGHLGAVLSLSPSGMSSSPSFPAGFCSGGNGGAPAMHLDTSAAYWDTPTAMVTDETSFQLQDYMGVTSTAGHGVAGVAVSSQTPSPSPWACFSSPAATPARATETLPLFPTGDDDDGGPRARHGGAAQDAAFRRGSHYYLPCWGSAAATAAATATTTVTVQQHQLLQQLQEQHSMYSSSQLPSQDTAGGGAWASLELSLSSWCPYPERTM
ncbi:hypothetical protein ACP4OV_026090 [Aristida adscensionis]